MFYLGVRLFLIFKFIFPKTLNVRANFIYVIRYNTDNAMYHR